jgi:hypothetical protein
LIACIDAGLKDVAVARGEVQKQLADVRRVAATLDPKSGSRSRRRQRFVRLQEKFSRSQTVPQKQLSKRMAGWIGGLFVCVTLGRNVPWDNLDLERFFRLPKSHERRIHGHKHVGMRVVREGATLLPTLDAHQQQPGLFTAQQLLPYHKHPVPSDQQRTQRRHQVMRRAASTKLRPQLLQELNKPRLDEAKNTGLDNSS